MAKLTVAGNEEHLAEIAAKRLAQLIADAAAAHGGALVSLTGGTTPRRLYSSLADHGRPWRDRIPWPKVHLCWGDERHVPPTHPDSNYGMAKATLIDHIPIPPSNLHPMRGELPDAHEAAAEYDQELQLVASAFRRKGGALFDVMLLGIGEDAHIASIFPGSELLGPSPVPGRRVAAVWAQHLHAWRITLAPAAILDSRVIVMLVGGAQKADAVHAALEAPLDVNRAPAQLLRTADDRVEWFLDRAAASRLP